jgi:hypothetical protein
LRGCCERGIDEVQWQGTGCSCILAPGAATYRAVPADGGRRSVTFRAWLPTREGSPQADQATQIAAHFAARGHVPDADGLARKRFYLVMAHETPGDSRVRALAFPCLDRSGRESEPMARDDDRSWSIPSSTQVHHVVRHLERPLSASSLPNPHNGRLLPVCCLPLSHVPGR